MIIGIILSIIGVGILIWLAFSYLNFRKLKNYFDNYQNLEEEGGRATGMGELEKKENVEVEPSPIGVAGTDEKLEHSHG